MFRLTDHLKKKNKIHLHNPPPLRYGGFIRHA